MRKINLNDYTCSVPFSSLEIHNSDFFVCCPSWLSKNFKRTEYTLESIWKSKELEDIRSSLLDGSFKYCNKKQCPHLSKLLNEGVVSNPIIEKSKLQYDSVISKFDGPEVLIMNFDNTCNYKCPSCRVDLIVLDSKGIKNVEKTIDEIDNYYSKDVTTLYITGSGDPFVSVGFRNYLRNFNPKKYPKLKGIHLHTNASMWNEKMWESMPNVHNYVKSCEISIDAGTKFTYENKTRLGGNWDVLIENLKFINTIPKLKELFNCIVGLSDHTMGIGASVAAVALGARVIEKHFTLHRADGGVDSAFSLEPNELKSLVEETDRAFLSLGNIFIGLQECEKESLKFKRSIYVSKDIKEGEYITEENIRVIRPAFGLAPKCYEDVIGKKAVKNLKSGSPLLKDDLIS